MRIKVCYTITECRCSLKKLKDIKYEILMLFIFSNFYSVKEDIEHNYFHHYKMFKYPAGLFVMQVLLLK